MGGAIAGGLISKGVFSADDMAAFDVNEMAAESFSQHVGCRAFSRYDEALETLKSTPAVLLAVKPQTLEGALKAWRDLDVDFSQKLLISIVAGVKIENLSQLVSGTRIVRVMPNTPALVGKGAAAYACGPEAAAGDTAFAAGIFNAAGIGVQVPEKLLDAVTGLSGSGPAYVFEFIQALADGGVAEGLPRDIALRLAAQTVLGSAAMVLESGLHPAVLKDQVTSPGGTTSRGLEKLAERGFSGTVMQAVRAAAQRSAELGKR